MGNTVWVLTDSIEEDEWDHSLILEYESALNDLSVQLGVKKISDFYDHSILAEEFGGEAEPLHCDPSALETVFQALLTAIQQGESEKLASTEFLVEELTDCLTKIQAAKSKHEKVRIAIVP